MHDSNWRCVGKLVECEDRERDVCNPSPCGPNSVCKQFDNQPACKCLPTFLGTPPNCRPECATNSDCPGNMACIKQKCLDPCQGSCGTNANCITVNHSPLCTCPAGSTGDPFNACTLQSKTSWKRKMLLTYSPNVFFIINLICEDRTRKDMIWMYLAKGENVLHDFFLYFIACQFCFAWFQ